MRKKIKSGWSEIEIENKMLKDRERGTEKGHRDGSRTLGLAATLPCG
jgi:hypothetical protein